MSRNREGATVNQPKDADVVAPPRSIRLAYWAVVVGTVVALVSNVFELRVAYSEPGGGLGATTDLTLTIAFIAMFGFFVEMMRKGRQWGRVFLTIFGTTGLTFTTLGLLQIGGRPIDGTLEVILGIIGAVASVIGLVSMFWPSANAFFRTVREGARVVSPGLRKVMLTVHIIISVGWLGLIMGMVAMAVVGASTGDPRTQYAVYDMMNLLDQIFLGMTSLFAMLTGVVGAVGTKWHLMRRHWVATKFVITIVVMCVGFGVIHQLIVEAYNLTQAGAPVAEVRAVGLPLAVFSSSALLTLVFMTVLSTYKPWGFTRYGRRKQAASGARRPGAATPRAAVAPRPVDLDDAAAAPVPAGAPR
jgi:hypothetical protein